MSTCFGCEIQTVYNCLNRTETTENRHQKLKPNRKTVNRGSPSDNIIIILYILTISGGPSVEVGIVVAGVTIIKRKQMHVNEATFVF